MVHLTVATCGRLGQGIIEIFAEFRVSESGLGREAI
jgi:hypothetical protein